MEEISVNSSWSRDLRSVDMLTEALLRVVEAEGADVLTSTDITFLCQMVELDQVPQGSSSESSGSEAMVSIATNYLKLASLMLEPQVASWWVGQTDDGVRRMSGMFILLIHVFSHSYNFLSFSLNQIMEIYVFFTTATATLLNDNST